jgi:hypothetical protein
MIRSFRMTTGFAELVRHDLSRAHVHAHERVGFITAKAAVTASGLTMIAAEYHPVADEDYIRDARVGAMMSEDAVRKALQICWKSKCAMVHVHMHEHKGLPWFGRLDLKENGRFMPDFFNVQPSLPHAALVLSHDAAAGLVWPDRGLSPVRFDEVVEVGRPYCVSRRTL